MAFDINQPLERKRKGVQTQVKSMRISGCLFTQKSSTSLYLNPDYTGGIPTLNSTEF